MEGGTLKKKTQDFVVKEEEDIDYTKEESTNVR